MPMTFETTGMLAEIKEEHLHPSGKFKKCLSRLANPFKELIDETVGNQ